ncbi:MAG: sulfatase/phosphatase domain-containing protein [Planctomycetota bacterium]|jgi:arylsulfatase A-like enzyme
MKRRDFLKAVGLTTAYLALPACVESSQKLSDKDDDRPNILFIYSDDHAVPAISAYKSFLSGVVETPNLDRLANEGMRFDNAFCTNSICTPARATVLTGKYSHKNGALTLDVAFDGSQQTFPKLLQKAGYYTAIVGKWHLGTEPTGFDYYNVLPGQGAYFNPNMKENTSPWEHGFRGGTRHEGYVTDIITDIALETLKNRPKDKPFCMMYQHKAPHDFFQYDKKHAQLYKDIDIPEPFNLFDDYKNRGQAIKRTTQKIYMEYMDESDKSRQMLVDRRPIRENRIMADFQNLRQLHRILHANKSDEFDEILYAADPDKSKTEKVKSLVGTKWNIVQDSEEYLYKFNTDSDFIVSGGEAGEGITGKYTQKGEEVFLSIDEYSWEGTYDGVEFKLGSSQKKDNLSHEQRRKIAYQMYIKAYLRCVASIDDNVGRVLDYLEEGGLTENTIVIYTSDQGFFLGEHGLFDKRFMYDESLRIPLLVRYPKQIKAGSVSEDFTLNVDFAPTFLDYPGIKIPKDMDGNSLKRLLGGKTPRNWRTDMYYRYWMHRGNFNISAHYGIRSKRFKLIFYYGLPLEARGALDEPTLPEWELYDLEKDPYEMNNVYDDSAYAGVVKELKQRLLKLKEDCGDTDERYPELMEVRKKYW